MTKQIPRGSETLICPLHQKAMELVCHKCPWWCHVRGANPNTGEPVDEWRCAIGWLPMLLIETAQQSRQGAAATESMRNAVVARMDGVRPVQPVAVEDAGPARAAQRRISG